MIRHTSHESARYLRYSPPEPTEPEYFDDSIEITAIRDYSPTNHCSYLLLLTFIDILENPICALGSRVTAEMRHLSPRRAVKSRCINKIEMIEVPFFCISLILSQSVSRRRSEPQISQNSLGAQRPSTEVNTTLPRALRHKLSPKSDSNGSGDDRGGEENVNISQHFTTFSRNLRALGAAPQDPTNSRRVGALVGY